jgi:hypothetical protein
MNRQIFLIFFFTAASLISFGKITGSSFSGQVRSEDGNSIIEGTIELYYRPTGAKFAAITDENGKFAFPDVKSGGPYDLFVTYVGFTRFETKDIFLALGAKQFELIILVPQENVLNEITIQYDADLDKKGNNTHFSKATIAKLPTLTNSLQDVTRLSSQANGNSFAGTSYRYNNLSLDGSVNNDAFGFVEQAVGSGGSQASGTPGSMAKTLPISLEAIQDLQIAVAPY